MSEFACVHKALIESYRISYIASIFRMSCVPEPTQLLNKVDANIESGEYLSKQLGVSNKRANSPLNGHNGGTHRRDRYYHHHPRHYSSQSDYDSSYERSDNRVRPAYSRYESKKRHGRYKKPVVDDYDYYEAEPLPAVRRAMYKRLRAKLVVVGHELSNQTLLDTMKTNSCGQSHMRQKLRPKHMAWRVTTTTSVTISSTTNCHKVIWKLQPRQWSCQQLNVTPTLILQYHNYLQSSTPKLL